MPIARSVPIPFWNQTALFSGVFLLTALLAAFEMLTMRAAQVAFGQDFHFFIIPLALLGIGAGGAMAYARRGMLISRLAQAALICAVLMPIPFFLAHAHEALPLVGVETAFFLVCLGVYACGGLVIAALFMQWDRAIPMLYFLDLGGAAVGALSVPLLLSQVGYEQTVLGVLFVSLLPSVALAFADSKHRPSRLFLGGVLVLLLGFGSAEMRAPSWIHIACDDGHPSLYSVSNAFSQIDVESVPLSKIEDLGAGGQPTPGTRSYSFNGDCGSYIATFVTAPTLEDLQFLRQGLRGVPFAYEQWATQGNANAFIASAGAGIDVLRAELFEMQDIDATEFNPAMLSLAQKFAAPSTYPYAGEHVTVYQKDTRQFLSSSSKTYDLMLFAAASIFGTFAADADTPSYSMTAEALGAAWQHLKPSGMLVVATKSEGARELMNAVLLREGLAPEEHLAFVHAQEGGTELVAAQRSAFSAAERRELERAAAERGFSISFGADREGSVSRVPLLTDDLPYPSGIGVTPIDPRLLWRLLALIILCATTVIGGTFFALRRELTMQCKSFQGLPAAFSFYGAAIGFGFAFFEMGAIQKLFFLIADPTYAIAITLCSFFVWGGLGSLASRIGARRPMLTLCVAASALLLYLAAAALFGDVLLNALLPETFFVRSASSAALLGVPAFVFGMLLPMGFSRAQNISPSLIPWLWTIDGLFGVAGGLTAKFLFHLSGIHVTYLGTALSYGVAFCALFFVFGRAHRVSA